MQIQKGAISVTIKQEAYRLIDSLPEDSIRIIVQLMYKMEPANNRVPGSKDKKMQAFYELEKMRKEMSFPKDFDPEKELQEAIDER